MRTWSRCMKAFRVPGLCPRDPKNVLEGRDVLERRDVGECDDDDADADAETKMQLKDRNRAFRGCQELTSEAWDAVVWEVGDCDGILPRDAEVITLPAREVVRGVPVDSSGSSRSAPIMSHE